MPLNDAVPDAVSRVYAGALMDLCRAAGGRERAESTLGELEDILELSREHPAFSELLASRVVSSEARARSVRTIFGGRASDLTVRFLGVLNDKGRLGHLASVVAAFDELVQAEFGRVEADVFTAAPMSPDQLDGVRRRLSDVLKKDVVVHPYVDESMIGGIKVRVGDRLLDGSVQARLRQMNERLGREGQSELRSRLGRMLDAE
jgi:F-type H+-transporting ATPase subunit delta